MCPQWFVVASLLCDCDVVDKTVGCVPFGRCR